jgi:phosphoribosylformylglycinamidine synthase
MASEEFHEGTEQKRPNVQVGDPFMEKLLLEACLEAMKTGAIVGIQDMGAAGLTCSTCEMGARGGVGLDVELDNVPQRETGMNSYEIMLSESQERMLLVAEAGRENEVLNVFAKWGLDAVIVGTVKPEPRLRIRHHGVLVADIPNESLTDDAPLYHRPVGTWKAPVSSQPSEIALAELSKPRDYTADLKKLLSSANICSKRWVHEQYDTMVQTNTVQGPGGEAGVMRIKGTGTPGHERGLSMALDGNGRWAYLDPKLGAMHAVAEAARKVACTGALPVAATNCLNFGNPEKPEIMAQLSAAIDGIAEACTALGTPITGGNVSLYNETKGVGIYPTPVIGIVGILDDVTKAVPAHFQKAGELILLIGEGMGANVPEIALTEFGSSEYAKEILGELWGEPTYLDLEAEWQLHKCLRELAEQGLVNSASDISDGGIATAVAQASFRNSVGATIGAIPLADAPTALALFGEQATQVILTCSPDNKGKIEEVVFNFPELSCWLIGETIADKIEISIASDAFDSKLDILIDCPISELRKPWATALESALYEEVTA